MIRSEPKSKLVIQIMILVGKQASNVRTITLNIYDTTQQQV